MITSRRVETTLAFVAAAWLVGMVVAIWLSRTSTEELWPLPGLLLLDIAVVGVAGLVGIALDGQEGSNGLGLITWAALGAQVPLVVLGLVSFGVVVLIALLVLGLAGALAAFRKERPWQVMVSVAMASAVLNFGMLVGFIAVDRAWSAA